MNGIFSYRLQYLKYKMNPEDVSEKRGTLHVRLLTFHSAEYLV